jgi:hypothetical protein
VQDTIQYSSAGYFCVQGQSGEASEAGGSAAGEEEGGKKTGLLEAIRLPLVSVFPRSKLKSTKVRYPVTWLPFAKTINVLTPDAFYSMAH